MKVRSFFDLNASCRMVAGLIWLTSVFVAADPRGDVLEQYQRAAEATSLKFLDGIFMVRSPDFELFNSEGQKLDLQVERTRTAQFLAPALSVDEQVKLVVFEVTGVDRARCEVSFTTALVAHDRLTDKEVKSVLATRCLDDWVKVRGKWLLRRSRVVSQEYLR